MRSKIYQLIAGLTLAIMLAIPFASYVQAFDILVYNVAPGMYYNTNVQPAFSASDGATVTATLNGRAFASGSEVSTEGIYGLVVTARKGTEIKFKSVNFTIDKTQPSIAVGGVNAGGLYNHNVNPTFSASDNIRLHNVTATINGRVFASGSAVISDGNYGLTVTAWDNAGNIRIQSTSFTLDKTAPVISISGVSNGGVYSTTRTITYSANEGTVSATLNGANFASGSQVASNGSYRLIVTARDAAGNQSSRTINFVISRPFTPTPEPAPTPTPTPTPAPEPAPAQSVVNNVTKFFRTVFGPAPAARAEEQAAVTAEGGISDQDMANIKVTDIYNAKDASQNLNSCDNIRIIGTAKQGMLVILYLKRDGSDIPTIGFVKAGAGDKWEFTTDVPLQPGDYTIYLKGAVEGGKVGPMLVGDTSIVKGCAWWIVWLWVLIIALLVLAATIGGWFWYRKSRLLEEEEEITPKEEDQEIITSRL